MVKSDLSLIEITPSNVKRDLEERSRQSDRMRDGEQVYSDADGIFHPFLRDLMAN